MQNLAWHQLCIIMQCFISVDSWLLYLGCFIFPHSNNRVFMLAEKNISYYLPLSPMRAPKPWQWGDKPLAMKWQALGSGVTNPWGTSVQC
jgi:hypothetical protein